MPSEFQKIFSVGELNESVHRLISGQLKDIFVKGEISNLAQPASGHIYFSLKEKNAQVRCALFKNRTLHTKMSLENGLEIIIHGTPSIYTVRGDYQIIVDYLETAGEGLLRRRFEELKQKLRKEGLFESSSKKTIPKWPKAIGIITSPTGSVVHDIINRVNDRFPMPLDIWPVSVQGIDAADSIINAIEGFNKLKSSKPDILIVARGGGSTEDLMAFNDENLATSVFESKIPIISAIGHETDTTIIDLVSDLRASTPTAAAEKATPVRFELIEKIKNLQLRLNTKVNSQIQSKKENYEYLNKFLKSPSLIVNNYKEKLLDDFKNLTLSIENKFSISKLNLLNLGKSIVSPDSSINLKQTKINNLSKNLNLNIANNYKDKLEKYKSNIRLLNSNSISSNLKKGYSILMDKKKIVKTSKKITTDDQLSVKLIDGTIDIKVTKIN